MSDREHRVGEAVAWYYQAAEAGSPPNPAAFLARFPDLGAELTSFLADKNAFDRAAGPPPAHHDTATVPPSADRGGPAADPTLGAVRYFGDYELLAEIARGGMGVVFHARQVSLNREVALKMILTGQLASAADVARFRAEAEAAANLDHPSVLPIYEVGEHQGQQYFAMKLVPGGSLAGKVAEYVRDPKAAMAVFVKVCRAVDFAHRRGILHRDLKPGNVLLDADGTPYVTDFGLAKKVDGDSNLTQSGAIVGTPSYMAPEQARAEKQLTTAADVYALGAILYELLTGRPPFRGPTVLDTILQVLEKDAADPRTVNPKADRDLSVVALKCLEKNPAKRYESAGALADDLDRWLRGEPILARPVTRIERAAKWIKRNPVVAGAVAALVLVLVAGVAVSSWFAVVASDEATAARTAEKKAEDRAKAEGEAKGIAQLEKERADVQLARAEWLVYAGKLLLAQKAIAAGQVSLAQEYLNECQWDLRGWEHRYLWTRSNGKQSMGHTDTVNCVAFSPDGKRVATGSGEKMGNRGVPLTGEAKVWDAEKGQVVFILKHTLPVYSVAFSPDGKRIVTGSGGYDNRGGPLPGEAWVWDADTGTEKFALKGHTGPVSSMAFSPNGKRIITGSDDKTARVWDAETGTEKLAFKSHTGPVSSVAFSPDGKRIVTGSSDATAKVWDAENGQEVFALKGHTSGVASVAFSPDGQRIVTGGDGGYDKQLFTPLPGEAKVWDAENAQEVLTLKGHTDRVFSVAFSPDGKRIVTGSGDNSARVWDAEKGQQVLALKGHTSGVTSVCFSPDGKRVVTGSGDTTAKVWDAEKGQEGFALKGHTSGVAGVCFNHDNKRIVTGSYDNMAKVWDAENGQEVLTLKGHTDRVFSVAFSLDGKRIITGSSDSTAKVWDAENGQEFFTLKHTTGMTSVAFSPDGQRIVTGSSDATVKVWEAEKGREVFALKGHTTGVTSVAFSPDGQRIVTGGGGGYDEQSRTALTGEAKVWDAEKGQEVFRIEGNSSTVAFSPDGKRIVTGSGDGMVKVWDAENGQEVLTLKGHTNGVNSVCFSPDGQRIVSGSEDGTVKVWEAGKGQEVFTLEVSSEKVTSVAFSPDGKHLVTGSGDNTARLWDAEKGQELFRIEGNSSTVAFSPDGKHLVTGDDKTAKVWDVKKGQEAFILKGHTTKVISVAFSPDSLRVFAWDAQKKVLAWSLREGEPVAPDNPPAIPLPSPVVAPDGRLRAERRRYGLVVFDPRRLADDNTWPLPDAAERKRYHTQQSALAEKEVQWFAAAFHHRQLAAVTLPADPWMSATHTAKADDFLARHEATILIRPVVPAKK